MFSFNSAFLLDRLESSVMSGRLTTKEYWARACRGVKLPKITKPENDVCNILETFLPKSSEISFIEIGCAPGGWMAFFNRHFGYSVSGIEYVDELVAITQQNMGMQGIHADILNLDFFQADLTPDSYDVVFSGGFIEHFEDLNVVVSRIAMLSRKFVITTVPNLYGLNGFVSRVVRPKVFYSHNRIEKKLLRNLHEESGLETLFCNYVGGLQLPMLSEAAFFDEKKRFIKHVNLPFRCFNLISRTISKYTNVYPRTRFMSAHLMYIGRKRVGSVVEAKLSGSETK